MYEISIKHKDIGKRTYNIYTKDEADSNEIDYKYWKEADKGEYALTDDNYVGEIIQKKRYTGDNGVDSYYVRMPFGYAFHSPKYPSQRLKADGRVSNHTMSGKSQLDVRRGTQEFKSMVKDELKEVLSEKGHNRSKTIDLLDEALEMARKKGDITNFLRVAENIQDMLGMKDKTVTKTTTQLEATATRKLLDEINEEEQHLKGTQTKIEAKTSTDET